MAKATFVPLNVAALKGENLKAWQAFSKARDHLRDTMTKALVAKGIAKEGQRVNYSFRHDGLSFIVMAGNDQSKAPETLTL